MLAVVLVGTAAVGKYWAIRLLRQREFRAGLRFLLLFAAAIGTLAATWKFIGGERGNRVWIYRQENGQLALTRQVLLGSAQQPLRHGGSLELREQPMTYQKDGWTYRHTSAAGQIVNDTGARLRVGLTAGWLYWSSLADGQVLVTRDRFEQRVEVSP